MKVRHVRDRNFTVYIGRPSIFGNPFIIGKDGTRKQVIKQYEAYVRQNDRVMEAIRALKPNAILGCHCSPKPCHGSVIVAIHKELTESADANNRDVPRVSRKSRTREDLHGVSRKGRSKNRKRRKQS